MRTVALSLIFPLLSLVGLAAPESFAARPYDDADAYEIYSLLLPQQESYDLGKDLVTIQESAIVQDISGACLTEADAKRFKDSIAGYNRVQKRRWLFQRQFHVTKQYRIVGKEVLSALPHYPQGAGSYLLMSAVGFNRNKTQAIVFIESVCGGLCGSWRFHFLKKVHRNWSEIPVATCVGTS